MKLSRVVAVGAIAALLAVAAGVMSGALSLVTTFGVSMAPRMAADDLVVVRSSSYTVGDVVAYLSPELQQVVLHRIVDTDGDHYVFQGDNNDFLDPERLPESAIVGKELLHIPRGGIWMTRLTSPPALAAYAFLLVAGGTTTTTRRRHRRKEHGMSPRHRSRTPRGAGSLHPSLQPIAATAAVVGLLGTALAGIAFTRPVTATAPTEQQLESRMDFSYTATVPPSAAYDSTTVNAPQPVFRALTDDVDVIWTYAGQPGEVRVDARLSSAGGWRSNLRLTPQQPLASEQQGRVRLDLSDLERRAAAAAEVTGIPTGALTVTVIPRIWTDGGGQFAPELPLTLQPATLTVDEQALTATTSTSASRTGTAPAQLTALGRSLDVQTARHVSAAAVAAALLAGVVLLGIRRLAGPVAEAERIRMRHKDVLLPVLPVALTPGRPVVDVADVEHLVRLAERYGLLVLHWQRSGVTTYVVQDEGATYRYRSWGPQPARDAAAVSSGAAAPR